MEILNFIQKPHCDLASRRRRGLAKISSHANRRYQQGHNGHIFATIFKLVKQEKNTFDEL
jgi:hypothetical protein